MKLTIALAGNPNSGKTTMFNNITGSSQYVGNWPGVTVEKKEGRYKGDKDVKIVDLPGIYSLSPYTLEEVVSRNYLIQDKPDVIINIVDAGNLERNLYLTTQLLELGIPVVVALNMIDVVNKRGDKINTAKLAQELGCPVVETAAVKGSGLKEAVAKAIEIGSQKLVTAPQHQFDPQVEGVLQQISAQIQAKVPAKQLRWHSIKLFERDAKLQESLKLDAAVQEGLDGLITACEEALDDDSESVITNERYQYIGSIINGCQKKKSTGRFTASDKIDKVVTNRWLALPIFVLVMGLVYFIAIATVGTGMTDWVNEVFFEEIVMENVEGWLEDAGAAEWLTSLLVDGIIAGVGAVLGFLPQMLVLFLFLAILEDCGYMARVAFIMDRIFRKFGLSGKSFIPMLVGTGCSVPAIMASRTIENERDRRMTVITTSFIPCGAKLPIIALIAGALFDESWWVAVSAYFVGVAAVICSGIILKKTKRFTGDPAPFVMELPAYHVPGLKTVLIHMWDRGKSFVKKAGTIIFVACAVIWFLSNFSWGMEMVDADESILASMGRVIAPVFRPLGFGTWEAAVATVTGLVAKENVVATFGILFGYAEVAEDGVEIWANLRNAFVPLAAYCYLLFNLLCAPCFAAIGAIKREMGNWGWTLYAVGYQTALAYVVSLVVFQLGSLFTGGGFGFWTVVAILLLLGFLYLLFRPAPDHRLQGGKKAVAAQS